MKTRIIHDSTTLKPGDIVYLCYDAWPTQKIWPPAPRIVVILELDGGGRTREHGQKLPGFRYSVLAVDDGHSIVEASSTNVMMVQSMSHENFAKRCAIESYIIDHI